VRAVSLLIFDLDGTLVNTLDDITASVNHTVKRLGRPQLTTDAVRQYVGDGIETLMVRSLGGQTTQIAEAVDIYKEHHRQNLTVHSSLYPGVRETLEYYKTLPMAVISNKTMEFVSPLLEHLGIRGYFRQVIGADSGLPLKPAPAAVEAIVAGFKVPKDRAVIVGDGTTDVRAGKAAGIITCSVTYGFRSEAQLRNAAPDHVIHEFAELRRLFSPER
jgi:phosphoglycolate phosphatase